jgi:hypothetical protein
MPLASPETHLPSAKKLSPEELEAFGKRRYGARRWRVGLAQDLGLHRSTILRMVKRQIPISELVMHAVRGIQLAEEMIKVRQKFERQMERAFR